jgi:hypothetical protein
MSSKEQSSGGGNRNAQSRLELPTLLSTMSPGFAIKTLPILPIQETLGLGVVSFLISTQPVERWTSI